jgi:hypothetical protein
VAEAAEAEAAEAEVVMRLERAALSVGPAAALCSVDDGPVAPLSPAERAE